MRAQSAPRTRTPRAPRRAPGSASERPAHPQAPSNPSRTPRTTYKHQATPPSHPVRPAPPPGRLTPPANTKQPLPATPQHPQSTFRACQIEGQSKNRPLFAKNLRLGRNGLQRIDGWGEIIHPNRKKFAKMGILAARLLYQSQKFRNFRPIFGLPASKAAVYPGMAGSRGNCPRDGGGLPPVAGSGEAR